LKHLSPDIYYHSSTKECDFLTVDKGRVTGLYQICYELTDQNREQEYGGLQEAMNQYSLTSGTIITLNQEEEIVVSEGIIRIIPAWRWFLNTRGI